MGKICTSNKNLYIYTKIVFNSFLLTFFIKADEEQKLACLHELLNCKLPKINRYCFQLMIKLLTFVLSNFSKQTFYLILIKM